MEQAIQVYVYSAIGCVPAVLQLWTAFIVHDAIWLCYTLLLVLLPPPPLQYGIIPSLGPGKIGIEEFLCKAREPL